MPIRFLKITLILFIGLMCILYALQNLTNLQAAQQVIALVLSMSDHQAYPNSMLPAIHSPMLTGLALAVIITLEMTAGVIALKGCLDLWQKRHASSLAFQQAKCWALLGCGLAVLIWFGLFGVIGGAWFQMWQTELGSQSLNGAFQFATSAALVLIFVNMPDE